MVLRAKIIAPSLHGIVARQRLYRRLMREACPGVTWIVGPPGSGKTTLAAGYMQHLGGTHLWFQADAGDGDPAAFFASLGEAILRVSRRRKPALPIFGPEFGQDPLMFSRRFFEGFFERLPAGSVCVLDNYQEIPPDAPTHDMLREGMSVLPPGVRMLVVSRQPPPAGFARLQANGELDLLEWDELRMTDREAMALLRARTSGRLEADRAFDLCQLAGGWPAGLVLMAAEGKGAHQVPGYRDRSLLFDYFANEVFQHTGAEVRTWLMQLAVLPRCTAVQAQELTGSKRVRTSLRELIRSGYFTVAHGNVDPSYEFHPLFREFLLHQAAMFIPAKSWNELQTKAASLLERDGQIAEAFELHRKQEDTDLQIRLILSHAQALLSQNQHRTLSSWIECLPAERVEDHSWLSLWLGHCLMPADLPGSRSHLERAFEIFGREGDLAGQMQAWCAVVDTWLYAWDDYAYLDPWIDWLDRNLDRFGKLRDTALIEAVSVSMTWAIVYRRPEHPDIVDWIQRAERILREGSHPQIRLRAGTVAMMYRFWAGEWVACDLLTHAIHGLAHSLQEPMALLTSYWAEAGMLVWNRITVQRSRELIEKGLALGERFGIHFSDFMFHGHRAAMAIGGGDQETARQALASMERVVRGHNSWSFFHYLSGWAAFVTGDLPAALAHAELSLQGSTASGMPSSEVMNRLVLADLLFEAGRFEESETQMRLAEAVVVQVRSPLLEMMFHQGVARRTLTKPSGDRDTALAHLRRAMALGREYGFVKHLWRIPAWQTLLCATALEHGIETEFVQRLIRLHSLRPSVSPLPCADWPWEIRIETLGRFSIQRNGHALVFPTKAPRKVLLLLKALVAAGPGGVGETRLVDWLWPEAEGDAGQQSLETGLHRLRQLLGVEGAVVLREGHLTLDPRRCWVDAHAFESWLESGEEAQERALGIYGGPFLEDLAEPWGERYRQHLKERFLKAILAQGRLREEHSDPMGAIACYERGLLAEPLVEEFYRRIMVCHRAHGSCAEGLRVHERCRNVLKTMLDVEPSPETERLASSLRGRSCEAEAPASR